MNYCTTTSYYFIKLIPFDNNRIITTSQPKGFCIGASFVGTATSIGDVLTGLSPAAFKARTLAGLVVAGASAGTLDVTLVAAKATLGVAYVYNKKSGCEL